MSCLGTFRPPRSGAPLVLIALFLFLLWPAADVAAREGSGSARREAAATQAKAAPKMKATAKPKAKARAAAPAGGRRVAHASSPRVVKVVQSSSPARPSLGHAIGLHAVSDPLSLRSAVALVMDERTGEVLLEKNARAVLPIASISKLLTAMVVLDAQLPMSEVLEISEADVDTERNTRSRLRPGARLSRGELLQLALMSSENRAAHALGRHYPGGMPSFVEQMNRKAREIGMSSSHFVEPTGLSSQNVSSAHDLATLVRTASSYPLIREYSTANGLTIDTGYRTVSYRNTNRLIGRPDWDIGLQKTGYISEAGNCVVMQTRIDGRPVVLVLLDAEARMSRFGDAQRIRNWLERTARTGIDDGPGAGQRVSAQGGAVQTSRDS